MTSLNNISNTTQLPDFSRMSKKELENGLRFASQSQTLDTNLIQGYIKALESTNKQASLETLDIKTATKQQIHDTVLRDIRAKGTNISREEQAILNNTGDIEWYMLKLFQDEKANNNKLLTETNVKDYFSIERMRNSKLLKTFQKLEADRANYPKNVLVYAMGIVSSKYFGLGQSLKRGIANLTWNRKSENIRDNIDSLLQRCEINSNDSPLKRAMKEAILGAVRKAKNIHISKLEAQNTF